MALANYSDLVAEVQAFMDDAVTITPRIPTFIRMTEARVNRLLQDPEQEARATLSATGQYTPLPADFGELVGVTVGTGRLRQVSAAEMAAIDSSITGTPIVFAIADGSIALAPVNATANIQLLYRKRVPPLTSGSPTNWLMDTAPDVYLYGCLSAAAQFTVDDERAPLWNQLFENAIEELRADGERRRWGAAPLAPALGRT